MLEVLKDGTAALSAHTYHRMIAHLASLESRDAVLTVFERYRAEWGAKVGKAAVTALVSCGWTERNDRLDGLLAWCLEHVSLDGIAYAALVQHAFATLNPDRALDLFQRSRWFQR